MSHVAKSVLLPFTSEQMYALVEGVEAYPQFLPWCASSQVHARTPDSTEASIELNFKGIRQTFTTLNRNDPGHSIHLALLRGPFRSLTGHWQFLALGERGNVGCKVSLQLDYEFSNAAIVALIGSAFDRIAAGLLDAFVNRAFAVYDIKPT